MENNQNHNIDKIFNEAAKKSEEDTTFSGFEKVWSKVEKRLDENPKKNKIIPIWFPYAIAASLAIVFGVLYFINRDESLIKNPPIVQNTPNKENTKPKTPNILDSAKIENLDTTIKENILKNPIKNGNQIIAYHEINGIETPSVENMVYKTQNSDSNQSSPKYFEKTQDIEGIVLTGGIKIEKSQKVSSYTTVSKEEISGNAKDNILNALTGKVDGLDIQNSDNQNDSKKIKISGLSPSQHTKAVLYVVDGIVYQTENHNFLGNINPENIKDVQILKGTSAVAIYGSPAQNGAIIITTKKLSKPENKQLQRKLKKAAKIQQNTTKYDEEEYDTYNENPFELTKNQPLSTFSVDVDKASYSNIRRMINNGEKVNKNAVRIEEMLNYFQYNYPQPTHNQPFSINTEYSDAPWNKNNKILKIGLQGKALSSQILPASNFVFLIDVSGSMSESNKLPLLKSAFKILLEKLRPTDRVALVVYAGNAGVVLPSTFATEKVKISNALDQLEAGGSTAGGEGIELAYQLAQENFIKNGNNRVILATDGDFNVGIANNSDLQTLIEEKRNTGIYLTCLGFGMGNYKDNRLEMLSDKGNGNYAYIDNLQEANKFLGQEFFGNMYTIAKDLKIQIEFNPNLVESYRLIGYENRKLRNEDFTNDKVDAGEIGIGHSVTALYEIIPKGVNSKYLPENIDLKYTETKLNTQFQNEIATIKFRYKNPEENSSKELVKAVTSNSAITFANTSPDFKFATAVAWFGLVLRKSDLIENKNLDDIAKLASKGKSNDQNGYRSEFIRLVEAYKSIDKK